MLSRNISCANDLDIGRWTLGIRHWTLIVALLVTTTGCGSLSPRPTVTPISPLPLPTSLPLTPTSTGEGKSG